jgi:vancomycin resistance protein YoaR
MDANPTPPADPDRSSRLRAVATAVVAIAAVVLVAGGVVAWGVGVVEPAKPNVTLVGAVVPPGASTAWFLERLRGEAKKPFSLRLQDGETRTFAADDLGITVDSERIRSWFDPAGGETGESGSNLRIEHFGNEAVALPVALQLDAGRVFEALIGLKDEFDRAPADARVNFGAAEPDAQPTEPGNASGAAHRIIPEQGGRWLDVGATFEAIRQAVESGDHTAAVVFREVQARRKAAELAGASFDAVLAEFDTPYDRSRRSKARTFNLALAASKLDGTVLMPGEVFDFNAVVGPRDEANGYQVAPVIAQGELVDGIGGGTCQVSGTLFSASFFAGLEVLERNPHTRPSSYIKLGLDAAVAYPSLNLRLKNPYDFPIALRESVRDGKVHSEVRGPARARTVTFIRRIVRALPYEEIIRDEPSLPKGKKRLAQRGVPGFQVRRYRIVRDGAHAVREKNEDIYPATPQIVLVGSGGGPSKKLPRDTHPEYRADELLVMTLDGDSKLAEQRRPGRFGKSGWTEREGMPVWKSKSD